MCAGSLGDVCVFEGKLIKFEILVKNRVTIFVCWDRGGGAFMF